MYAVYNYKAGSTAAQVLSDIIAILTGTTSPASLSASCVQANTSITSTVAAGWAVFDAAAAANAQVLRAQNQDGTTFKYFKLDANTAGNLIFTAYESWNATTHAGTNGTSTYNMAYDIAGGGYFYIYATSKNAILLPWTTSGYNYWAGVMEFTRDTVTPTTAYPCICCIVTPSGFGVPNGSNAGWISRTKSYNVTGDLPSMPVYVGPINAPTSQSSGGPYGSTYSHQYRDASDAVQLATYPIGLTANSGAINLWVGSIYDLRATGSGSTANLDEIVYSGQNYVCFRGNTASTVIATLLVPKA